MNNLVGAFRQGLVLLDPTARKINNVLSQVVSLCTAQNIIPVALQEKVLRTLQEREQQNSTSIGNGVAIPHAYVEGISHPAVVFVRLKHPIDVSAVDDQPTRYLFVLIGPTGQVDTHLDTLASVARAMLDRDVRYDLGEAQTADDVVSAFEGYSIRHAAAMPPGSLGVSPGLTYTGDFCGGLVADIRRRLPDFVSDFTEGLHPKSITATLFLFFACLAPAVTFGGLMYTATGGMIGATEMLVATAICGILYALCSGQPLVILGGTGPLLIFTGILYQLCQTLQIPFLESYAWVGLWTALFTLVLALSEASCLIRHFTRFTDEIFAALISLIFIAEALNSIVGYVNEAHAAELAHDVAFLSLIMALGTFIVAMMLSRFRKSRYLVPYAREFLADFDPTLAVLLMLLFGL